MLNPTTLDMIEFVKFFVQTLQPDNYLELGLYLGETISYCKDFVKHNSIGVDISIPKHLKGYSFYNMTTDEFFKQIEEKDILIPPLDMVFIDADHSHEQSLKDFNNVFPYVVDQGLIFLHDTFPKDKKHIQPGYCGDVYKTAVQILDRKDCEIITLPVHPGLSIVRKRKEHLNVR